MDWLLGREIARRETQYPYHFAYSTVSFSIPLCLPVTIYEIDNFPHVFAGGVPVLPINLALKFRHLRTGATKDSLDSYVQAARLYVEFCAHRHYALGDVTNEAFSVFISALAGQPFSDADGNRVHLTTRKQRSRRTIDHIIVLLYSLASDINKLYHEPLDWWRYEETRRNFHQSPVSGYPRFLSQRTHRVRWDETKIQGLPDTQFDRLLLAARDRWLHVLTDGDKAFATQPEEQRGALFFRNAALLLVLRYCGSRRSEVAPIRFEDLHLREHLIYLETKGHRRGTIKRLPVILYPRVHAAIWKYVTCYRPDNSASAHPYIFASHSVRNYGQPIADESVRAIIDALRIELDPPWNTMTPHQLRHAFGYDLQKQGGPYAVTANMRHASVLSGKPYAASVENFLDELIGKGEAVIETQLARTHLEGLLG